MAVFINNGINCLLWVYTWFLHYCSGNQLRLFNTREVWWVMAGAVSAHLVLLPGEQDGSEAARSFFFPPNFFVRSTLHPSRWWNCMEWPFGDTFGDTLLSLLSCGCAIREKGPLWPFYFSFFTLKYIHHSKFVIKSQHIWCLCGWAHKNLILLHVLCIMKKKK